MNFRANSLLFINDKQVEMCEGDFEMRLVKWKTVTGIKYSIADKSHNLAKQAMRLFVDLI